MKCPICHGKVLFHTMEDTGENVYYCVNIEHEDVCSGFIITALVQ